MREIRKLKKILSERAMRSAGLSSEVSRRTVGQKRDSTSLIYKLQREPIRWV